jgi:multiple sugar transport system permease protein
MENIGLTMLFFLAGLLAIPPVLFEAAVIDGANSFQKHWYITIPLLRKTFAFVLITTTIRSFQVFGPILMATNGGPLNRTRVVTMDIYENAFVFNQMGYASALSVILATVLIVISIVQMRIQASSRRQGGRQ